jgi:hypothetical protein
LEDPTKVAQLCTDCHVILRYTLARTPDAIVTPTFENAIRFEKDLSISSYAELADLPPVIEDTKKRAVEFSTQHQLLRTKVRTLSLLLSITSHLPMIQLARLAIRTGIEYLHIIQDSNGRFYTSASTSFAAATTNEDLQQAILEYIADEEIGSHVDQFIKGDPATDNEQMLNVFNDEVNEHENPSSASLDDWGTVLTDLVSQGTYDFAIGGKITDEASHADSNDWGPLLTDLVAGGLYDTGPESH